MEPTSQHNVIQPEGEEVRITISAEEINTLPLKTFEGKTVVVSDVAQVEKAIKEVEKYEVVGFDTETRPSFIRWHFFN